MPDSALACKRLCQRRQKYLGPIFLMTLVVLSAFSALLLSATASAATSGANSGANAGPDSGQAPRADSASHSATGANLPQAGRSRETLLIMPVPRASWGFDVAFYQNGARSGALLQGNAPEFGPDWMPQFGIGLQSVDIEGHPIASTSSSSEIHSAEFAFISIKFQNPYLRGMVRTFAVARIGALLTSDVAHSDATGAGYLGFGGEFPYAELANALFAMNSSNRSVSFYVEAGVPLASESTQATSIQGSPYIFNGVATTIGFKYAL